MEEYRKIKGHENYSVSNFGNVRNDKTERILKATPDKDGYKKNTLNGKTMIVHRLVSQAFISNPENKKCIDHIDCERTNNNVNNLRWVTHQQNNFNRSMANKNIIGHKGIKKKKNANKYEAYIMHNYKYYHLGYFDKIEDAIIARQLKANELFGLFTHSSERIVNLNITVPPNTRLNININVEEEEYQKLEEEFERLIK
jgi:hypothetical protein